MPTVRLKRSAKIFRGERVRELERLFDLAPLERAIAHWDLAVPIEDRDWKIGLIIGPSGSGKSSIARALFGGAAPKRPWPRNRSVLDGFSAALSTDAIVARLSAVGFSSPPDWRKPFHVLSTGEQFRVELARRLAESDGLVVVDEFTSSVDRTVARTGSSALARAVRAGRGQLVAVTSHEDIIEWLSPDWLLDLSSRSFCWRERTRPALPMLIGRAERSLWRDFAPHHYLNGRIHPSAQCFVGMVDGRAAAFLAAIPFPHPRRPGWREHRLVCLPAFRGVGLGHALAEAVAAQYRATGRPYFSTSGHPGVIAHRSRSPLWKMIRRPGRANAARRSSFIPTSSRKRRTASFEFVGPPP